MSDARRAARDAFVDALAEYFPRESQDRDAAWESVKRTARALLSTPEGEAPPAETGEKFTRDNVAHAIKQFLDYGEHSVDKCHKGYFSGGGWAARVLRYHVAELEREPKRCFCGKIGCEDFVLESGTRGTDHTKGYEARGEAPREEPWPGKPMCAPIEEEVAPTKRADYAHSIAETSPGASNHYNESAAPAPTPTTPPRDALEILEKLEHRAAAEKLPPWVEWRASEAIAALRAERAEHEARLARAATIAVNADSWMAAAGRKELRLHTENYVSAARQRIRDLLDVLRGEGRPQEWSSG